MTASSPLHSCPPAAVSHTDQFPHSKPHRICPLCLHVVSAAEMMTNCLQQLVSASYIFRRLVSLFTTLFPVYIPPCHVVTAVAAVISAVPTLRPPSFSRLKQSGSHLGRAAARRLFLAELTSWRVRGQGEGHRRHGSGPTPFLAIGNKGQQEGLRPLTPRCHSETPNRPLCPSEGLFKQGYSFQ